LINKKIERSFSINNIILNKLELNFNNMENEVYGIVCEAGLSKIDVSIKE
jgi:hypothetical protein